MDSGDHVRDTFAYFGRALYYAQILEHGIVNAMVVLHLPRRATICMADIDAFMDNQFENTLGKLLQNLRSEIVLPDDLEGLLKRALKTRNWLCHDYFRERAAELMSPKGRDQMIEELEVAQRLFHEADACLSETVQPIADRFGLTKEALQSHYEALLKENKSNA